MIRRIYPIVLVTFAALTLYLLYTIVSSMRSVSPLSLETLVLATAIVVLLTILYMLAKILKTATQIPS